jgi:hypothetical protein
MLLLKYNSLLYYFFLKNPIDFHPIIYNNQKLINTKNILLDNKDKNNNELLLEFNSFKKDNYINNDYMFAPHTIDISQKLTLFYKENLYEDTLHARVNIDNFQYNNIITFPSKNTEKFFLENEYFEYLNHYILKNDKSYLLNDIKEDFKDFELF